MYTFRVSIKGGGRQGELPPAPNSQAYTATKISKSQGIVIVLSKSVWSHQEYIGWNSNFKTLCRYIHAMSNHLHCKSCYHDNYTVCDVLMLLHCKGMYRYNNQTSDSHVCTMEFCLIWLGQCMLWVAPAKLAALTLGKDVVHVQCMTFSKVTCSLMRYPESDEL